MSEKKAGFNRWQGNQWAILALCLVALLLIPLPGNTEEKKGNNRLPSAPDTGSPKEDFSAGGTRDNRGKDTVCGVEPEQIAYLLGNRNREFTLSAHPTFWFHIPQNIDREAQIKFVVTELETNKKIYDRAIAPSLQSTLIGIDLPKEKPYSLSPETNYAWSLEVDCAKANSESEIVLSGWVTRLSSQSELENQLATTPETEKHTVYLKHNFLYDALTELAQLRIAKPNDIEIETSWNQLLTELGWSDFIQQESATEPSMLHMRICSQQN